MSWTARRWLRRQLCRLVGHPPGAHLRFPLAGAAFLYCSRCMRTEIGPLE